MSFLTSIKSGSILFGDGSDGSQSVSGEINNYATGGGGAGANSRNGGNANGGAGGSGIVLIRYEI